MEHQLINFNIPINLKVSLDKIAKSKCLSRTAIINQLLETYCRTELQFMASQQPSTNQRSSNGIQEDEELPLVPFLFDLEQVQGGWTL